MPNEKKEVIIPIKGLNYRDKGYKMEDGYCTRLHNMAYRNGSWRGVKRWPKVAAFNEDTNVNLYKIAYKHKILGKNEFIAYYYVPNHYLYRISWVKLTGVEIVELQKIAEVTDKPEREKFVFSEYGTMLIMSYMDRRDNLSEWSFVFYEGAYVKFDLSGIVPVSNPFVSYSISTIPYDGNTAPAPKIAGVTTRSESEGAYSRLLMEKFDPVYLDIYNQFAVQGYIHGALYAFAAYKLYDGTVVRNGDVFMLIPDIKKSSEGELLFRCINGDIHEYYMELKGFKPSIDIGSACIASVIDIPFVESIVIYASPCDQIYDIDTIFEKFSPDHPKADSVVLNGKTFDIIRADVILDKRNFEIMNKPFYAVAEVDFRTGQNSVTLDYNTHIRDIQNKPVYSPNYSVHNIISRGIKDVNGRMHRFSLMTNFFQGTQPLVDMNTVYFGSERYVKVQEAAQGINIKFIYTLNIDGKDIVVSSKQSSFCYQLQNGSASVRYMILPNLITYPDARARKLSVILENSAGKSCLIKEYKLKAAASNNYAFYQNNDAERVIGYNLIERPASPVMSDILSDQNKTVSQPAKMLVSMAGNPYVFDPVNTYTVGNVYGTEIVDVNIPVDDVSDSSFGNYPLYVFTTTGIFAMERNAGERVYATEVLVNGDNVKQGARTIAIGTLLYYLTDNGVTALKARDGIMISGILNGERGVPGAKFDEYMEDSSLLVFDAYKELGVFNKSYEYAYVYSSEGKAWSTREMKGDYIGGSLMVYLGDVLDLSGAENGPLLYSDVETHDIMIEKNVRKIVEEIEVDMSGGCNVTVSGILGNTSRVLGHGFMQKIFYRLQRSWFGFRISLDREIEYINAVRIRYMTRYK